MAPSAASGKEEKEEKGFEEAGTLVSCSFRGVLPGRPLEHFI